MTLPFRFAWISPIVFALAGCATVRTEETFQAVQQDVESKTGHQIQWSGVSIAESEVRDAVESMLADGLTVDEATQVALLNNPHLQGVYEDYGIAQAELVEAGLLHNPVFSGELLYETSSAQSWELEVAQDFLSVLFIPLRRAAARDNLEMARLRVIAAVIDIAGDTRRAFLHYQADSQAFELLKKFLQAEEAGFEMAVKLREAGNIPLRELAAAQSSLDNAKLTYSAAELDLEMSRERVNRLMGLWGTAASWDAVKTLPEPPESVSFPSDIEREAVSNSVDLAMAWTGVRLAARRSGIRNVEAVFSELEVGTKFESSEPESGSRHWEVGPVLAVSLPLFNQGQAARAMGRAEVRGAWHNYTALAVELRSATRAAAHQVNVTRQMALYEKKVALPVAHAAMDEALLRYNGMFIGPVELLRAKQQEIQAGMAYVSALMEYWLARTDLEQILLGRLIIRAPEDRPDIIGANIHRAAAEGESGGHE